MSQATTALPKNISNRRELIEYLHAAARMEHSLCLQYLYAIFSLRRTINDFPPEQRGPEAYIIMQRNQRWAAQMMQVARQEMDHLGIVQNLLAAIGEPPSFWRPNFPQPPSTSPLCIKFWLQRLEEDTLRRFVDFEMPAYIVERLERPRHRPTECPQESIQSFYDEIRAAFSSLPVCELFDGDNRREVQSVGPAPDIAFEGGVTVLAVTNRAQASAAIDLITQQGEGIGDTPQSPDSHYSLFVGVLDEYRATREQFQIDPALPVVTNPAVQAPGSPDVTRVTYPQAVEAIELFNDAYFLTLVMLERFFDTFRGYWGLFQQIEAFETEHDLRTKQQNSALLEAVFFPLMTMVIRPLGEVIQRLPAFENAAVEFDCARAGPSFELAGYEVSLTGDFAFYQDLFDKLVRGSRRLAKHLREDPPPLRPDTWKHVRYLHQNLYRMRLNFDRVWHFGEPSRRGGRR